MERLGEPLKVSPAALRKVWATSPATIEEWCDLLDDLPRMETLLFLERVAEPRCEERFVLFSPYKKEGTLGASLTERVHEPTERLSITHRDFCGQEGDSADRLDPLE